MYNQKQAPYSYAENSTGQTFTESAYLENHFLAMQPEYEMMLRWVGIEKNWRILDAGCGGGSYLTLLTELVGEKGKVTALDLAVENLAIIQKRAISGEYACPVEALAGNIVTLPYAHATFDAVWNANVSQYLDDQELETVLQEFCRVVRPGGIVAVKEFDNTGLYIQPGSPLFTWHYLENKFCQENTRAKSIFRAVNLHKCLREANLKNIRRKTFLIERYPPLRPVERAYIASVLKHIALNVERAVSLSDYLPILETFSNANSPDYILDHPDFYWREQAVVVTGQV